MGLMNKSCDVYTLIIRIRRSADDNIRLSFACHHRVERLWFNSCVVSMSDARWSNIYRRKRRLWMMFTKYFIVVLVEICTAVAIVRVTQFVVGWFKRC